ncbi:MAG: trypsin-like peptidase domain-containing protein [Anaerolineae bacterium]
MSDLLSAQAVLNAYSQAIHTIAAAVGPGVVRIQAGSHRRGRRHKGWRPGRARTNHGSGFIIDAEQGIIATNFHVVRDADQVLVHLSDGTPLKGRVLGSDPAADLATIQVTADNLTALNWGDSDALQVGDHVLAFGNPDGDSIVVTSGIVSTLDRRLRGPSGRMIEHLIQTDTIFNPGMSGGPLVNSAGQVVGINTASLIEAQGINLAISSAVAQPLIADLVQFGQVRRPVLGIAGERQRLYEGLVRHHRLEQTHGVYIHDVMEGYPAADAGITAGDILIGADGHTIEGLDDLHRVLSSKQHGDTMPVRLLRDLDLLDVTATLNAPPEETE